MTTLRARIASLAPRDALSILGLALTAAWLFVMALFWLIGPAEGGAAGIARLVSVAGAVLPLGLIWVAVILARAIATLRAEAAELRMRLTQLREMAATRGAPQMLAQARGAEGRTSDTDSRAASDAPVPRGGPSAAVQTIRGAAAPAARPALAAAPVAALRPADQRQSALRFETEEAVSIAPETLIRALNFPDGGDDVEGIAALRAALKDQDTSRVLRAAQDIVTLLSRQDIYMDDLQPQPMSPGTWRRFADGARGSSVASLGAIQDPAVLGLAATLLRRDEVFRDAAHHFMRHFDTLLGRIVPELDDAQIATLTQTRSARAFMLLGRVSGVFG